MLPSFPIYTLTSKQGSFVRKKCLLTFYFRYVKLLILRKGYNYKAYEQLIEGDKRRIGGKTIKTIIISFIEFLFNTIYLSNIDLAL